jgi:hypothetical protein
MLLDLLSDTEERKYLDRSGSPQFTSGKSPPFLLVRLLTRFPGGIEGCPFTGVRSCERRCRFRETMLLGKPRSSTHRRRWVDAIHLPIDYLVWSTATWS